MSGFLKKQWAGSNLYDVLFVDAVEDELAAQGGRSDGVRPRHQQEIRQLCNTKQHRTMRSKPATELAVRVIKIYFLLVFI